MQIEYAVNIFKVLKYGLQESIYSIPTIFLIAPFCILEMTVVFFELPHHFIQYFRRERCTRNIQILMLKY